MKYYFLNDYSEGAHPAILEILTQTNFNQEEGYGLDSICKQAEVLIKQAAGNQDVDVHFISGGTQTNLIMLGAMLKPFESVIAANTGHINVHEAGAIEATGHRIDVINTDNGKIYPDEIQKIVTEHEDEHMVKPKVVFISQSTEVGTIYTKSELLELREICDRHNLFLYLDGARLGSALCSKSADLTLQDICNLVDALYIGGTKNGALLGEAVIIKNQQLKPEFRRHLKQRGALLAKGRILGAQFVGLFSRNLYYDLATHANNMADKLTNGIKNLGYNFLTNSPTNQIFPIFSNNLISQLQEHYKFYVWCPVTDTHSAIRLVTSWATKEEAVNEFIRDLESLKEN